MVLPIRVYHVPGHPELDPWQRAILTKLDAIPGIELDESLRILLAEGLADVPSAEPGNTLRHLQENLFGNADEGVVLDTSLSWLGVRDALEEAEIVAGMIQKMLGADKELAPSQFGLLLDGDRLRDASIKEVFGRAGLPLAGLRAPLDERNLGAEAVFLFLASRRPPAPSLALASLYSQPIMPWPLNVGVDLANQIMNGDFNPQPGKPLSSNGKKMLSLIQAEPATTDELSLALQSFVKLLFCSDAFAAHLEMAVSCTASVVEILMGANGKEIPWPKIMRAVPQSPISAAGTEEITREGITIFYEDEEPWRNVRTLFVLGFNDGHYPASPRRSPIFDDTDLKAIRKHTGIELKTNDEILIRNRTRFLRHLRSTSSRCVFLVPFRGADGKSLAASGTLSFMARLIKDTEDPEALILTLEWETDRSRVPNLALAKPAVPVPSRVVEIADLELGRDLLTDNAGKVRSQSPTRLEKLIVSPLAWLLDRLGVSPRDWAPESFDPMTSGNIAHELFEHLFAAGVALPDVTRIQKETPTLISAAILKHAPFLNRAEWSVERKKLEADIGRAALAWREILEATGAKVVGTEVSLKGDFEGLPIGGRTDLILELPDGRMIVVDYKKSTSTKRRRAMENGCDIQASLYRRMIQTGTVDSNNDTGIAERIQNAGAIGVLYYLMDSQEGLSDAPVDHHDVDEMEGDISGEAERRVRERIDELRQGIVCLNHEGDGKRFYDLGIGTYCLDDSPLISRFSLPDDAAEGGD